MTGNLTPNNSPKVPLSPAAAALISAAVGCFAMIVAHQAAIQSKALSEVIITLGSWIPNFIRVSFYPGEEAVGLLVWLTSWFILHQIWKQRDLPLMPVLIAFSGLILAATVMIFWHPI